MLKPDPYAGERIDPLSILDALDRATFTEIATRCDVSLVTVHRWRKIGILLQKQGERIFLPAVTVGRRSWVRWSHLNIFLDAVREDRKHGPDTISVFQHPDAGARRRHTRKVLTKAGIISPEKGAKG